MTKKIGHLHLVCGYICAGKSTLCKSLSAHPHTVHLSEDQWLSKLFGPDMQTIKNYVTYSARLQSVLTPHITHLLKIGVNVVLDFPSNTPKQREWCKDLIQQTDCSHTLHFLDVPLAVCKERLTIRNAAETHPFSISDDQFDQISAHFIPPDPTEGFVVNTHSL